MANSLSLNLIIAIVYFYFVLAHSEFYFLIDTDLPFIWNLLTWYLSKDKSAKNDIKYLIWSCVLRFHKCVLFRAMYRPEGEALFTEQALLEQLPAFKMIIAFQLMGFLVPKKVILKIADIKIPQTFADFMDQTNFTGSVLCIYSNTVKMYQEQNTYTNYLLPSTSLGNAIIECFLLQAIGGMMGPCIDMVDHFYRFGWQKVKQEYSAYLQSGVMIYTSGCVGVITFELYHNYILDFLASSGIQSYSPVLQNKESLFNFFMIVWWIMYVVIKGFYENLEDKQQDQKTQKAISQQQQLQNKVTSS